MEYLKGYFAEHLVYYFVLDRLRIMTDEDVKSRAKRLKYIEQQQKDCQEKLLKFFDDL